MTRISFCNSRALTNQPVHYFRFTMFQSKKKMSSKKAKLLRPKRERSSSSFHLFLTSWTIALRHSIIKGDAQSHIKTRCCSGTSNSLTPKLRRRVKNRRRNQNQSTWASFLMLILMTILSSFSRSRRISSSWTTSRRRAEKWSNLVE